VNICLVSDNDEWLEYAQRDLHGFDILVTTNTSEIAGDVIIVSSLLLDQLPENTPASVIVVTARNTVKEAINAYRAGASRYLPMSFSIGALRSAVVSIIVGKL